jgi:prepilin-type N-terminal cleavage/methylation domain-containing protein
MEILKNHKSKNKGYTLIELIVVLALFSLLFTIAIPNSKFFKTYNQNQQLRVFEKDLRQARNTSIIDNSVIYASFHPEKNSYLIKYAGNEKIVGREFSNGVKLSDTSNTSSITFHPDGIAVNTGTIIIMKGSEEYEVAITPITSKISLRRGK